MFEQNSYEKKCVTAEEAVSHIKSGDRVMIGHAVGEPSHIVEAMVKNYRNYENVEIVHEVLMGTGEYCNPEMDGHFFHNALFTGANSRAAIERGQAAYLPGYFHTVPGMIKSGELPIDVCLATVTPPDEHGMVSLGVSVDYTYDAVLNAKIAIAQVNKYMPKTYGQCTLSVNEFDYFVKHDEPLIQLKSGEITEVEEQIGRYCASLVEDGATLQLGIGSLPDAILKFLHDKKDLGLHTEMFSDSAIELIDSGVINGKRKTYYPNQIVATFLMGTDKLYNYVNNNSALHMAPVDLVNTPSVAALNDKLTASNSCIQIDLKGQVCSESVGTRQISGVGGQVDFFRAARLSKGGKAILAVASSAANGKVSKIVPFLNQGATVTTGMYDIEYVVTEYGIANLRLKNLKDRARALIRLSHPNFRPSLIEEYENRFQKKYVEMSAEVAAKYGV